MARRKLNIPRRTRRKGARAFSMIEMLIVVAILGIVGALVLPKFSDASHTARQNMLKDDLRYLRTQIIVFKAQHRDVPPGYPNGNTALTPTADAFVEQMTRNTNELCAVGPAGPAYKFGPYLSRVPPNPINNLATIRVIPNGSPMPAEADNSTGWIYKPETLEIVPNSPGTDANGTRYIDY